MSVSFETIQEAVQLWLRRREPESADLDRSLSLAQDLESDNGAPIYLRSMVWHLVEEVHESAGWPIPDTVNLSRCRGAAASVEHASALAVGDISSEVATSDAPVIVLGTCAAGRALFGRWDLLPACGAVLIPLVRAEDEATLANVLTPGNGVRWASAGPILDLLQWHSFEVQINGLTVRVPKAELIAALTARRHATPDDIEGFLFCTSSFATARRGTWNDALSISRRLGLEVNPQQTALQCNLADWLEIPIPPLIRARAAVTRLLFRATSW